MAKASNQKHANDSGLNFEAQLWAAAEQAVPVARVDNVFATATRSAPAWGMENYE